MKKGFITDPYKPLKSLKMYIMSDLYKNIYTKIIYKQYILILTCFEKYILTNGTTLTLESYIISITC